MSKNSFFRISTQLDLPFLETRQEFLKNIFNTLEFRFGLKKDSNQKFIDLGSGDGRIIIYSALNYQIKSVGVEINSNLVKESKERLNSLKKGNKYNKKILKRIIIKNVDFYAMNLNDYDFIYIFSLPTMHKYLDHLFRTTKVGAVIISHKYPFKEFNSYLTLEKIIEHTLKEENVFTFFYTKFK